MDGTMVAIFAGVIAFMVILGMAGEHLDQLEKQACLAKGGEYAELYRGHLCVRPGILVQEK